MSTPHLDDLGVQGKRSLVLVSTNFLLVLSFASFVLRIFAKLYTVARIQYEDWFMGVALLFSLGTPICEVYGLSVGLEEYQANVSVDDQKRPSSVHRRSIPPSYSFTATIKSGSNNTTSAKITLPSSRLASKTGRISGLYTRMSEDLGSADQSRRRSIVGSDAEAGSEDI
ncbi:hypothetical protein BELL_0608g00070 [Botrytis elliptica]|uniref:Integral membrane protein n=1 Tax=Botrytis elliptica TaxID=278938 RepID=A0A4Z1JI45_9HELO|nr:hypothetical protein EAE99_008793 [Botrytis elliptica]TGO71190.1 hypothetical protein BELL_0608g00070 [Botrytis elliptica]